MITVEVLRPNTVSRLQNIGLWMLQLLAVAVFMTAASANLGGSPEMVATFEKLGLGQGFRLVIGSLEMVGAILLLMPRLAGLGASLLSVIMVGAIVLVGGPTPTVLLAMCGIVAWQRGLPRPYTRVESPTRPGD